MTKGKVLYYFFMYTVTLILITVSFMEWRFNFALWTWLDTMLVVCAVFWAEKLINYIRGGK